MNIRDFRRIALSLEGVEESSHMGGPDFRVGNRIFATLAAAKLGYGNIMITPEQQAAFVDEMPEVFIPVKGGWGRNGATHFDSNSPVKTWSQALCALPGNFASIKTPGQKQRALRGQNVPPRRAPRTRNAKLSCSALC